VPFVPLLTISLATAAVMVAPASASPHPRPNAVTAWNAHAGKAALAACIAPADNPLNESRMYAMSHLAIHDALNAIDRRSEPYAYDAHARRGASPDAAVAAAARDVLVSVLGQLQAPFPHECIDAGVASVESDYAAALDAIRDGPRKRRGLAVGHAAATAVLALRAGDGGDTTLLDFDFPQGTAPGEWIFTPDRPFAFAPGWAHVTPFVLDDASQFRPGPPYALDSAEYAADLNEVKALGGDGITTASARTPEQTEVALFWLESSPLQWNRIARTLSASRRLDPWQSARLYALLDMALADGYIGSFDTKYHYRYWRPVSAIRAADSDGNPDTSADPTWTPLVTTPPIPDYDSAHAVEGGAAAAVFHRFFGTDRMAFRTCSLTLPAGSTCDDAAPVSRSYATFTEAAKENGLSRILVGFHFRKAVREGIHHGRRIGRLAARRYLRPAR
jgi:PAP2 superfamily